MTTAARPTWAPAKGGNEQGGTRIFGASQKYSSRDMAAHTSFKPRKEGQDTQDEVQRRNLREELEDRERRHFSSKVRFVFLDMGGADLCDYSAAFHLNLGLTSSFHPPLRLPFYSPPPVLIFYRLPGTAATPNNRSNGFLFDEIILAAFQITGSHSRDIESSSFLHHKFRNFVECHSSHIRSSDGESSVLTDLALVISWGFSNIYHEYGMARWVFNNPGPRDAPFQCLIKRDKKIATFYLHLALTPSSFTLHFDWKITSKVLLCVQSPYLIL
ncbi:Cwf15 / Cwc15 cell cycle control family protein [Perilla frutescens var. frutescens]|nr:Cwf15 / Cwc15 cell cycle control family protein [Perilla frutescens var. frutescens]